MDDVTLCCGSVRVTVGADPHATEGRHGKPNPQQWAAFVAAVLQALLALFGGSEPATSSSSTSPAGKK